MANDVNIKIRAVDQTKGAFDSVGKSLGGLRSAVFSVQGAIAGLIGASVIRDTIQLADAYTSVTSRLKLVSNSAQEFRQVQDALFAASQRTRAGFQQTVDLYSTLRRSTQDLGVSQEVIVSLTEDIGKALAVSGASGASAEAALVQLAQGFAAGALRGQEFMSVAEQAPMILDVLAKGLGKTRGELKAMADEGLITTTTFIKGFTAGAGDLNDMFEQMPVTVGGALTRLQNSVLQTVGVFDKLSGATRGIADAISFFSNIVDSMRVDEQTMSMAGLSSQLQEAQKDLDAFATIIPTLTVGSKAHAEAVKGQAEAQERFNRALYAFRGADIGQAMMAPLVTIPKKQGLTPAQQKEAQKAAEKEAKLQAGYNEALVSQMTAIERQQRFGIQTAYRLAEAQKANAKATTDAYVAARNLRQNVGLAEQQAILQIIEDSKSPLQQYAENINNVKDSMMNMAVQGVKTLEDSLVNLVNGTLSAKNAFRDMATSIINDLIRMQIQKSITGPLAGVLDGFFGSQSPAPVRVVNVNGNATGGPVQANTPYMVGERGAELFVPNSSGSIIPNGKLGGGGTTVVQNINVTTGVAQTVRAEIMTLMPQIAGAAKAAVADANLRGGSYRAALR